MQRRRECYRDDEVAAVVVRCIGFVRNDTHDLVTVGKAEHEISAMQIT